MKMCEVMCTVQKMYDIFKCCILCCNRTCDLLPMLNNAQSDDLSKLKFLLPELMVFTPEHPVLLCTTCLVPVKSFYQFKLKCLENNYRMTNYVQELQKSCNVPLNKPPPVYSQDINKPPVDIRHKPGIGNDSQRDSKPSINNIVENYQNNINIPGIYNYVQKYINLQIPPNVPPPQVLQLQEIKNRNNSQASTLNAVIPINNGTKPLQTHPIHNPPLPEYSNVNTNYNLNILQNIPPPPYRPPTKKDRNIEISITQNLVDPRYNYNTQDPGNQLQSNQAINIENNSAYHNPYYNNINHLHKPYSSVPAPNHIPQNAIIPNVNISITHNQREPQIRPAHHQQTQINQTAFNQDINKSRAAFNITNNANIPQTIPNSQPAPLNLAQCTRNPERNPNLESKNLNSITNNSALTPKTQPLLLSQSSETKENKLTSNLTQASTDIRTDTRTEPRNLDLISENTENTLQNTIESAKRAKSYNLRQRTQVNYNYFDLFENEIVNSTLDEIFYTEEQINGSVSNKTSNSNNLIPNTVSDQKNCYSIASTGPDLQNKVNSSKQDTSFSNDQENYLNIKKSSTTETTTDGSNNTNLVIENNKENAFSSTNIHDNSNANFVEQKSELANITCEPNIQKSKQYKTKLKTKKLKSEKNNKSRKKKSIKMKISRLVQNSTQENILPNSATHFQVLYNTVQQPEIEPTNDNEGPSEGPKQNSPEIELTQTEFEYFTPKIEPTDETQPEFEYFVPKTESSGEESFPSYIDNETPFPFKITNVQTIPEIETLHNTNLQLLNSHISNDVNDSQTLFQITNIQTVSGTEAFESSNDIDMTEGPQNTEMQTDNAVAPPENIDMQTDNAVAPPENTDMQTDNAVAPPENTNMQTDYAVAPPENTDMQTDNAVAPPENTDMQTDNAVAPPENTDMQNATNQETDTKEVTCELYKRWQQFEERTSKRQ